MPQKLEEDPIKLERNAQTKNRSYLRPKYTKQLTILAKSYDSLTHSAKSILIDKLEDLRTLSMRICLNEVLD